MGYDCTNTFPKGTSKVRVAEFLKILGYERYNGNHFYFYKDDDYKYYEGVNAHLRTSEDGVLELDTHTSSWRSKGDSDFHNFTIRQLRDHFGGFFRSDYGKNRYFKFGRVTRVKAEAGCYAAHTRFESNLVKAFVYLSQRASEVPEIHTKVIKEYPFLAETNWYIISNNLVIPYIVSCIEDYFKYTYIAILRYSPKKLSIIKGARIFPDDLLRISEGEIKVEESITKSMSFQNITKICEYFKDLDSKLDIYGLLKKPYRSRKESLYDTLERILNQRHILIHQNSLTVDYTTDDANKDLNNVKEAVKCVYNKLIQHYNWQPGFPY